MTLTNEMWEKVSKMNIEQNIILGPINTETLVKDPKHLAFTLARYKFAAKMMHRCKHVIEVGCGEGIGTLVFLEGTTATISGTDLDEKQIKYAQKNILPFTKGKVNFLCHDMITDSLPNERGDGLVCLDVIEHLHPTEERKFFQNCINSLSPEAIAVFGTPNKYAAQWASARSNEGHINLFDPDRLVAVLEKYFTHVFLFSMNDEVVHTGYSKMAHYLIALCVNKVPKPEGRNAND